MITCPYCHKRSSIAPSPVVPPSTSGGTMPIRTVRLATEAAVFIRQMQAAGKIGEDAMVRVDRRTPRGRHR